MLDKKIDLIFDLLMSLVPLEVYVQPHLCNWHSFCQQRHASLNYSYFNLVQYDVFCVCFFCKISKCLEMGLGCIFQF